MKSTADLVNEIKESSNILDFLAENHEEMQLNGLTQYLEEWIQEKNLSKADVVRRSNLNRAYVYQIFLGRNLRHTFTTRLAEAGVNIKVVQETLGQTR